MANGGIYVPVTVGLEEGVRSAISQVNPMMARLQGMVNQKPITLRVDVNGVKQSISKVLKDPKVDAETLKKVLIDLETRINKLSKSSRANTAKGQADLQRLTAGYGALFTKLQIIEGKSPLKRMAADTFRTANALNQATKASNRFNSSLGIQEGYVGRLLARTLVYTGLFRAVSMIKNVRDVTAEFELQEVALGAIIQDTERASQLFSELKVQALKSPFQIKDLVSYTKQLAVYRIETENLFDTTKRLADISAGLGVDMQRLILAYGQVRAASVLRGQELRQFTEAGVPLVEELAKKFSQLRGQMVSTSEVFELISQRAVPFSMIKEIFEDMTNAGGVFYEMQLKQSETLKGQWSNLKDAISLMYDEMGDTRSVRRGIEGVYKLIRNLASNWRDVGRSITGVVSLLGVYSAIMPKLGASTKLLTAAQVAHNRAVQAELALGARSNALGLATIKQLKLKAFYLTKAAYATNVFGKAWYKLAASFLGGGWVKLAVAAVGLLVAKLASAAIEANRLNRELSKISSDAENRTVYLQRNFIRLANIATDSSKSAKEQQEAVAELQRTYSDIIPSQDLEINKLIDLKENYESVTQAIRDKIAAQTLEQQMNKVEEDFGQKLTEQRNKAIQKLMSNFNLQKEEARRVLADIEKANEAGEKFTSGYRAIFDALERQGIDTSSLSIKDATVNSVFRYIQTMDDLDNKLHEVQEDAKDTMSELGQYAPDWKKAFEEIGNIVPSDKTYEAGKAATAQKLAAMREFIIEILKKETNEIDEYVKDNQVDFNAIVNSAGKLSPQLRTLAKRVQKEYDNLSPTDKFKNVVTTAFEDISKSVGVSMDKFVAYLDTGTTGIQDYVDKFAGYVKDYQQTTREMVTTNRKIEQGEKGTGALLRLKYTPEQIKEQKDATTVMEQMLEFLREYVAAIKGEKAPTDNRLANLNEEVSLLEKVYRKYKEYAKILTATQAKQATMHYFEDTIKDLRFGAAFDAKEFSEILKKYQEEARKLPKSEKSVLEIGFKADDALWEQEQENIEKRLKRLAEDISQSETARNFFNEILARTGDRQLAADMTISVYGEVGDDLKAKMIDQIMEAFKGIDVSGAIQWDTLSVNYQRLADIYEQYQAEMSESNRKLAKEIVDNGVKSNADWLKNLYSTYQKAMDYEKRMQLERSKADEKIAEIKASTTLTEPEKAVQTKAVESYRDKEITKIMTEQLKNSEEWIKVFEDVDRVGTASINHLMTVIKEFIETNKESLDPQQLKTLMGEYEKLYNEAINRNPFLAITDSMKEYIAAQKALATVRSGKEEKTALLSSAESEVEMAREAVDTAQTDQAKAEAAQWLADAEARLANAQRDVADSAQEERDAQDDVRAALTKMEKGVNSVKNKFQKLTDVISSIQDIYESFGGEEDTDFAALLNGAAEALKIILVVLTGVAAMIALINELTNANPILLAISAILAVILAVSKALANIKVNRANREIERQEEILRSLEKAYKDLEKAIEDSFGTDLLYNYNKQLEVLQAKIEAYNAQAEAEESKGKKADEEKVRDYRQSAEDAASEIIELQDSIRERMAGTDLTSAARDFANAWIEAYKEFSNTTDALSEEFQEMIQNMVVESLAARLVQSILKPLFDQIDEYNKDGGLTESRIAEIAQSTSGYVGQINAALTSLMSNLAAEGYDIRKAGSGLSGISKDIAGASEESILGLAAGINTQNYYISQIHANVAQILMLIQGNGAQIAQQATEGTALLIDNPYLTQYLPSIDQHTANIEAYCAETLATLNKVIKPRGTQASHVVNAALS